MAFLIAVVGVGISFGQGIVYAEAGGISVPHVSDHFDKPKEGPKPAPQQSINKSEVKAQKPPSSGKKEDDDGSGLWDVTKFVVSDVGKDMAGEIEPHIYDVPYFDNKTGEWVTASPNGVLYTSMVKIPRAILGNLVFEPGSAGKIFIDAWDGTEKGMEVWEKYKTLKEVNELENKIVGSRAILDAEKIEKMEAQLGKLKTVTKFSKGVAIVGLGVSAVDLYFNAKDTYQAWKAGDAAKVRDSAISAAGSLGEGLMSAGALLGPTPWGVGLAATGFVLWAGSALWQNREGIKNGIKKAWNGAKAIGNSIKNGLKSAWHGIFG